MVPTVGGPIGDILLVDEFVDDVSVDVVGISLVGMQCLTFGCVDWDLEIIKQIKINNE